MNLVTIDLDRIEEKIKVAVLDEEYCRKMKDIKGQYHCIGKLTVLAELKEMILNTPQSITNHEQRRN